MARRDVNSMWAEACAALAQAERLHRQFFEAALPRKGSSLAWQAPVDVFERGPELTIWVALPGVAPENVEISLDGATLRVAGVRRLQVPTRSTVIRRMEIPHGRFERHIELPAGSYTLEAFETLNGCVHLRLRRQ